MNSMNTNTETLLKVSGLKVAYGSKEVLHGIDLTVRKGEIQAVVGASGSGKSTLISTLLGLYAPGEHITAGSISLEGTDLGSLKPRDWRDFRRKRLGYVPQDPMTNLNPSMRVGDQIADAIKVGPIHGRVAVRERVIALMNEVGIDEPERRMKQYPHEFSGGMCQRILIAIALARDPSLIVADEPTSALDVTVQKQILDHMVKLVRERGATLLFITHNLGLAAERAGRIAVMHDGRLVETGTAEQVVMHPQDAYTKELIKAAPGLIESQNWGVSSIDGNREGEPVLRVEDVVKEYRVRGSRDRMLMASNHVSFTVEAGTTTAIVGESGSGKTTIAKMILGLEMPTSGRITVNGLEVDPRNAKRMHDIRTFVQPVFQNPYASLDPTYRIADVIREPLDILGKGTPAERDARVAKLLDAVALPQSVAFSRPSQLSGGQRQRVAIARALAIEPKLLVLDEAVSALDVLVQDQILQLLRMLQSEYGYTYLFITHDLGVARQFADNVVVLRHGTVEEQGPIDDVFDHPKSDYAEQLLAAIPHPAFL
ncbi:ABC transporter ATP-binding protein [Bifidobacterium vespertilionis]|nr:ABC transporter ATP-binding protein [Bifidobacterium vespertilionis]